MQIKIVQPGEPSQLQKADPVSLPTLPREEAYRIRRATRNAADSLSPWALKEMVALYDASSNEEFKLKILDKIMSISMSKKANEEVDPEGPVLDARIVDGDPLLRLERDTEKSGTPGVE